MKEQYITYFKNILEGQLQELAARADTSVSGLVINDGSLSDPLDRASFDTDQSFMLRIRDRERRLMNKIKQALERIEEGTYGICEMCGENISIARLKARPVTTYCIECKIKMEYIEKASGF